MEEKNEYKEIVLQQAEEIEKLKIVIEKRERQLEEISIHLSEYNEKLQKSLDVNDELHHQIAILTQKLLKKDQILQQELGDKEIIFNHLQKVERENDQLKAKLPKGQDGFFKSIVSWGKKKEQTNTENNQNIEVPEKDEDNIEANKLLSEIQKNFR